jgi:hypothetical protein
MKLLLGNIDYRTHMTDEGEQLQRGLVDAGWTIAGYGYGDGCRSVKKLLERHNPSMVFIQDKRDWSRDSRGCFNSRVHFEELPLLAAHPAKKISVFKDAGSVIDYQRRSIEEVGADAVVTYYHSRSVLSLNPWLVGRRLIRTYHSVDADLVRTINLHQTRRRGIVTGAVSSLYPLRRLVADHHGKLRIDLQRHPGYHNHGSHTPTYLKLLARFKVHVATCSVFRFALRKIIESVAVGCTPVTNLPAWDVLPEIDDALVRVSEHADLDEMQCAIDFAEKNWTEDKAIYFSAKAAAYYDFRIAGQRLDRSINEDSRPDNVRQLC